MSGAPCGFGSCFSRLGLAHEEHTRQRCMRANVSFATALLKHEEWLLEVRTRNHSQSIEDLHEERVYKEQILQPRDAARRKSTS